jgi:hypothetical protein
MKTRMNGTAGGQKKLERKEGRERERDRDRLRRNERSGETLGKEGDRFNRN